MKKEDFIKQMKDKYSHLAETNKRASVITGRVIEIIENYQPIYRGAIDDLYKMKYGKKLNPGKISQMEQAGLLKVKFRNKLSYGPIANFYIINDEKRGSNAA